MHVENRMERSMSESLESSDFDFFQPFARIVAALSCFFQSTTSFDIFPRVNFRLPVMPRMARQITLTVIFGAAGSVVAIGFGDAIHWLQHTLWGRLETGSVTNFAVWGFVILSLAGLISGAMLAWLAPDAAGSGIPQLKVAYWRDMGRVRTRAVWVKFLAGAVSIGGGMSLGREGPTVQLAGGICSLLGRKLGAINLEGRAATACGAAAGLAAAFNTPIAAVTFVLEEILDNLNSRLVGRILLASFVSVFVLYLARGEDPVLVLPKSLSFDWHAYLLVIPAAAVSALVGVAFQKASLGWRQKIRSGTRVPQVLRPLIGAMATWVAATAVFAGTGHAGVIGMGYADLNACLAGTLSLAAVAALLFGKWIATTASYAWGGCGGIFAPTLFLGAFTGYLVSAILGAPAGLPADALPLLAVTGMSACLGAVVRAPATSILIVFEMTHDFALVPPLMLGALISQFISRRLCAENFYAQVIKSDGIELETHRPIETFSDWKTRKIAAFATFPAHALPIENDEIRKDIISTNPHTAYPMVDANGITVGVGTQSDWGSGSGMIHPAKKVQIGVTLGEVERCLVDAPLGLLVVVDPKGHPLGVFTLHDLLRCQLSLMESEAE
jgi:chloride channel protein, CIC family